MAFIGSVVFTIFVMVYSTYIYAFTTMHLWNWFISPIFGLSLLSMYQASGIQMFVSFLTHQINIKDDDKSYAVKIFEGMIIATFFNFFALLGGYILYHYFQ